MDNDRMAQERIARQQLEEDRRARPITYLSKTQKRVFIEVSKDKYNNRFPSFTEAGHETPEAAALESLASLGLIKMVATKGGVSGRMTSKGELLIHENPKLRFAPPEGKRWIITTCISLLALAVATIAMVRTYL